MTFYESIISDILKKICTSFHLERPFPDENQQLPVIRISSLVKKIHI